MEDQIYSDKFLLERKIQIEYFQKLNKNSVECVKQCGVNLSRDAFTVSSRACVENCIYSKIENTNLDLINFKK